MLGLEIERHLPYFLGSALGSGFRLFVHPVPCWAARVHRQLVGGWAADC